MINSKVGTRFRIGLSKCEGETSLPEINLEKINLKSNFRKTKVRKNQIYIKLTKQSLIRLFALIINSTIGENYRLKEANLKK